LWWCSVSQDSLRITYLYAWNSDNWGVSNFQYSIPSGSLLRTVSNRETALRPDIFQSSALDLRYHLGIQLSIGDWKGGEQMSIWTLKVLVCYDQQPSSRYYCSQKLVEPNNAFHSSICPLEQQVNHLILQQGILIEVAAANQYVKNHVQIWVEFGFEHRGYITSLADHSVYIVPY
jgi:hypothetical protein